MPLTRSAQDAKEADTVRSRPNRPGFHCPDLDAVDRHLLKLSRDLHLSSTHPDGKRRIREDMDALLERRALLCSVRWPSTPDEAQAAQAAL